LKAFLTALDTSLSRTWREEERSWRVEDRSWRAQDMDFRVEERDWWHLEHLWRQENRKWRAEDVEQRVLGERALDLAEVRGEESPRRRGEERAAEEHLEPQRVSSPGSRLWRSWNSSSTTPRLSPTHVGEVLIVAYAVHHRDGGGADAQLHGAVFVSAVLDPAQRQDVRLGSGGGGLPVPVPRVFEATTNQATRRRRPKRSFEAFWESRCEDDWKHAFRMFTCGVPVFMVNIACVAWLKFHYSPAAAGATTAVAVVAAIGWAKTQNEWGWHVARGARADRRSVSAGAPREPAGMPFDWHARPSARRGFARGGFRNDDDELPDGADAPSETEAGDVRADAAAVVLNPVDTTRERGDANDGDDGAGIEAAAAAADSLDPPTGGSLSADAEGDFVRRASPRARDIARRSSLENAFDGSRRVAGGQAEAEEPFAATAEALRRAES
jgi:calcium release-activated calcium channel protein 1